MRFLEYLYANADRANPPRLFAVKTFADQTAYKYETRVTEHMGPLSMIYLFYAKGKPVHGERQARYKRKP